MTDTSAVPYVAPVADMPGIVRVAPAGADPYGPDARFIQHDPWREGWRVMRAAGPGEVLPVDIGFVPGRIVAVEAARAALALVRAQP